MAKRPTPAFDCPNCGEEVPAGALACPACGSDEETGWSEDTAYDGLDLPIDDVQTDFDPNASPWKRGVFIVTAALLLIAFFWFLSLGGRLW